MNVTDTDKHYRYIPSAFGFTMEISSKMRLFLVVIAKVSVFVMFSGCVVIREEHHQQHNFIGGSLSDTALEVV